MSERMNKERAREILKTIRHNSIMQTDYTIDDIDQALDIAIECIEHEEKCNKAINDSAKAIAKMQELCKECKTNNELKKE